MGFRNILKKSILTIILNLLLYKTEVNGQQYFFKHLSTIDGLSNSRINCIFNDSRGYTWIGTIEGGLCRYNGNDFVVYDKNKGLVGNNVNCISEDYQGNIWIGTSEGVSKFDGNHFISYTEKNGLKSNATYSITQSNSGKIYIASDVGGITILDNNAISYLSKKEGLPSDSVYSIIKDQKGILWIGLSKRGLVSYNEKKIQRFDKLPELCQNTYFASCADSKGNIWLGTPSGILYKFSEKKLEQIHLSMLNSESFISCIKEDKLGNIWVASQSGAIRISEKGIREFKKNNGLSSNDITSISSDDQGNIWFGTLDAGINLLNNFSLTFFNESDGFENSSITAIVNLNESDLIIGSTGAGLLKLIDQKIVKVSTKSQLDESDIWSVFKAKDGQLYIGTGSNGVFVLDNQLKFVKQIREINGALLKGITKICESDNGTIFIGTYGDGLFEINPSGKSVHYNALNSRLNSNNILCLHYTIDGKLLIGLFQNGLVEFSQNYFKKINLPGSVGNTSIYSIEENNEGVLFIGTGDKGIIENNKTEYKIINEERGLLSNNIQSLFWDESEKKLWIGSNRGVSICSISNSKGADLNRIKIEKMNLNCPEMARGCIAKTKNGKIWLGTLHALFSFDINEVGSSKKLPSVLLNEIRLLNQKTDWSKFSSSINKWNKLPSKLELNYQQNQLQFSFSTPGISDNIKYQYMIQGYDKNWSPAVSNKDAIYSSLTPGTNYIFKVRVLSFDNEIGPETTFKFSIKPPFWRTTWFYTLVLLTILISFFVYVKYRERLLIKEKKILETKVDERTVQLNHSNRKLESALQDITDSINYANRIQQAKLPLKSDIYDTFKDSFVLFKPKDIVSGDFYYFSRQNDLVFLAAADCTGHGIPGAFMSMIGSEKLYDCVSTNADCSEILSALNKGIKRSLRQTDEKDSTRDGMDIVLCSVKFQIENKISDKFELNYAGANRPIWIIRNGKNEIEEIKATKNAIAGHTEDNQSFLNHRVFLSKGDTFYLTTDGYADSFNGPNGKKLTTKKFKQILLNIQHLKLSDQEKYLEDFIVNWQQGSEQVDDILVIGVRL